MIRMKQETADVFVADQSIVRVTKEDLTFLIDAAPKAPRGRVRLCAHRDTNDRLQEMFIALSRTTYLQPSAHKKDESLQVLYGLGSYVFFDGVGDVTDVIPLGDGKSGRSLYCRIPQGVFHALVVESDVMMIHEITNGPFERSDTVFADWAPSDSDPALTGYRAWLDAVVKTPRGQAFPSRR